MRKSAGTAIPIPYKNDELQVIHQGISTYRVHGQCLSHGENRDIVASKSPMYENGKIVGLVAASRMSPRNIAGRPKSAS